MSLPRISATGRTVDKRAVLAVLLLVAAVVFVLLQRYGSVSLLIQADKITGGKSERSSMATYSSPIITSPSGKTIWVVNPDAGSVTELDPQRLETVVEIHVGGEPWSLASSPAGDFLYVLDRANGQLIVINTRIDAITGRVDVGPEPGTLLLNETGSKVYVSVTSSSEVAIIDAVSLKVANRVSVSLKPYALARGYKEETTKRIEQVYVTHLLGLPRPNGIEASDDGRVGAVTVLHATSDAVVAEIYLLPNQHGFPNLLGGIATSGSYAWVPHVRASPALPNGLTTTVFATVSAIDIR